MMLMKAKRQDSVASSSTSSMRYLVPTPEIDLFWHTHQLTPQAYARWCDENLGFQVNHDDTLSEDKLKDSRKFTSSLWSTKYGPDQAAQNLNAPTDCPGVERPHEKRRLHQRLWGKATHPSRAGWRLAAVTTLRLVACIICCPCRCFSWRCCGVLCNPNDAVGPGSGGDGDCGGCGGCGG